MSRIEKVGVLGAGVMGAGIAAHVANAGIPVVLLDIVPVGATDRNDLATGAIEKLKKAKPAALMSPARARLITPGNLEDHLGLLADCDWIVEAVVERVDVKQRVYRAIDAARKSGSIVSTNTSTIPLATLTEGLPESFAADFLVTHFFNPPRYMRLLELVVGPATRREAAASVRDFCDRRLGKSVVDCKDTPGFIANRIGTFWIEAATREAIDLGLTVEEADAVAGKPLGFPKTGVFGLMDLVGIDLGPHIAASLLSSLPGRRSVSRDSRGSGAGAQDDRRRAHRPQGQGRFLPARHLGRPEGQADHRSRDRRVPGADRAAPRERRGRPQGRPPGAPRAFRSGRALRLVDVGADSRLRGVAGAGDRRRDRRRRRGDALRLQLEAWAVRAARSHRPRLVRRSARRPRVDRCRRCSPRLARGPSTVSRAAGWSSSPPTAVTARSVARRAFCSSPTSSGRPEPVAKNGSASLWDLGDGVLCLEFHTKMNALDEGVLRQIHKAIGLVDGERFKALVIHNEGSNFSVGANIGVALFAANIGLWPMIEASIAPARRPSRR